MNRLNKVLQKGRKYTQNSSTSLFYINTSEILNKNGHFVKAFFNDLSLSQILDTSLGSIKISSRGYLINSIVKSLLSDATFPTFSRLFTISPLNLILNLKSTYNETFDASNLTYFGILSSRLINIASNLGHFKLSVSAIFPPVFCDFNRICNLAEIQVALFIGGIEPNPGPDIVNLEIITINSNGLTSDARLLQAIGKIKNRIKSRHAIIFLQETHNTNIVLLESIWKGSINISAGTGGSRGVITLCTIEAVTTAFKADPEGRFLFTITKVGDHKYLYCANLYSPNDHKISKSFFSNAINDWTEFCQEQTNSLSHHHQSFFVVAGDFNCVLKELDMQNRNWSCKERDLAESILSKMEQCGLYDSVLRSNKGNNYTWCRDKTFSKIDHMFVCENILKTIVNYDTIWDLVKSDHAAISININFQKEARRGRSYPKLNASDISSKYNREELRKEIAENIRGLPPHWNPHQNLDYIKMIIRTKTLELRCKDKIDNDLLSQLKANLEYLKSLSKLNDSEADLFNSLRLMVYEEEEKQAEKLKLMAGIKWREEGERSTKFFLNAVTAKQASSTLDYLTTDHGIVNDIGQIVEHAKDFYKSLYAKKECHPVENFYKHCPRLRDDEKATIDSNLTVEDLRGALKTCKDSTPGLDGIPYSYYKIYGSLLLPLIIKSWEYSNTIRTLPESQSLSVISLIPKAGKDKHELKNWRPISISSCDLKIITKALSLKVGKVLNSIISDSQMAYVPGRDINFNNRLVRTALSYCKSQNLDYVITSLDAQKAYDSVDHTYIINTLQAYNFPSSFISQVDLLNSNLQAQVQVNGFLSNKFNIGRGVKQGDALSCALFIIAIDPLIRNIENNPQIKSLDLSNQCQLKTIAYADDIAVITHNNNEDISQIFSEYMKLTKSSGLTLNADKTDILNLSISNKHTTETEYNDNFLKIYHKPAITICGNHLSLNETDSYQENVLNKIDKLTSQLNRWKGRNLSINGKMIIIKTFAISQLIFTAQFQTIRPKEVRKIEQICYSFMWNGPDRVKRNVIKSSRDNGGICGIDVESFFYTIAVRQFYKSNSHQKLKVINSCPEIVEDIKTNARYIIRKILINQLDQNDILGPDDTKWISQTRADLFVKSNTRIHHLLCKLGIDSISSISFESYSRRDSGIIRRSLPPKIILTIDRYLNEVNLPSKLTIISDSKELNICKINSRKLNDVIKLTLNKITNYHPANRFNYSRDLFGDIRHTWTNLWLIKNPSLRAIRLKVLYKDIWSQEKRYKLGITNSSACDICGDIESVSHQLLTCSNAKRLWSHLEESLNYKLILNGDPEKSLVQLMEVTNDMPFELVKSVVFKLLIQIDRSRMLTIPQLNKHIIHWLNIEMSANNNKIKNNKHLSNLYYSMINRFNS